MNVSLNIENDKELRAYIKDVIKGQVMSIIREEILDTMKVELQRKIEKSGTINIEYLIKAEMKTAVRDLLIKEHNVSSWGESFIKPYVNEKMDEVLKDKNWNKLVDALAIEKVRNMVK